MRCLDSSALNRGPKRGSGISVLICVAVFVLFGAKPGSAPAAEDAASPTGADGSGSAVVRLVFEPEIGGGTFRFTGQPEGELNHVGGEQRNLTAVGLVPGNHVTTLTQIDPAVLAAGYHLLEIRCDDGDSANPSTGDPQNGRATFRIEDGETATCFFVFARFEQECLCPKEGRWSVVNHTGSMICTGAMNMTVPLAASNSRGTIKVYDNCARFIGSGMSDGEADIEVHLQDDCSYKGSVGGSQDGIPMVIEFTMEINDSERITGELHSTVSQQGMNCNMSRTYELTYNGP